MANYNIPEEYWKPPINTLTNLPLIGNEIGDVRLVVDVGRLYYWDGSAWGLASSAGGGGGGGGGNSYFPSGF